LKVLVVGSGGREHALVWKIKQSPLLREIYCAPGNAGIAGLAETAAIAADDVEGLCAFVLEKGIDLTVIGPEAALAAGLADRLQALGKDVFGVNAAAARLESSKEFAKRLMKKYHIPTADYAVFDDAEQAVAYVREKGAPLVVKADGLAAGKGVVVAMNEETAVSAVGAMLTDKMFGEAGGKVVIEEFLSGEEVSILAFCDGEHITPMVSAQDHKRAYDGDAGPNTGGMGAYSPAPVYTAELAAIVERDVLQATLAALKAEGIFFRGILYAGLMVTSEGPKVLEFNCRFGDPETQPVLARLKTDLLEIIQAILRGRLHEQKIEWHDEAAICVVMAAGGYPGAYEKGREISGLREAEAEGAVVFHAGTALKDGRIVSDGGRVLGVTAWAADLALARQKAYAALEKIDFPGGFYRRDIGHRALNRE